MLTVESMVRPVGNVQEYRAIPRGLPCLKATERSEVTLDSGFRWSHHFAEAGALR